MYELRIILVKIVELGTVLIIAVVTRENGVRVVSVQEETCVRVVSVQVFRVSVLTYCLEKIGERALAAIYSIVFTVIGLPFLFLKRARTH